MGIGSRDSNETDKASCFFVTSMALGTLDGAPMMVQLFSPGRQRLSSGLQIPEHILQ